MRDKIISQLKAKYPGVNLSKARLDAIADKLAAKITDETEIDGKLEDYNDINPFAEIAKTDDRLRTLEAKTKATPPAPQPDKQEPIADEMPLWAKPLFDKLSAFESEKQQSAIKTMVAGKLKDVPAEFWGKMALPQKEEDIEAFATDINQTWVNLGLAGQQKPAGGIPQGTSQSVKNDIIAFAGKKN